MEEKRFSINKKGIKFYLNVGSFVVYNKKFYYICQETEQEYMCVPYNQNKRISNLSLNDFYFGKSKWINKSEDFEVISFLNNEKKLQVMKKYKVWLDKKLSETIKKRGSLIRKNKEYFYIFGETANMFDIIKIYTCSSDDRQPIIINNKKYWTLFEEFKILKNDNDYLLKDSASEDEMQLIKSAKKMYNKVVKEEINVKDIVNIGTIISLKCSPLVKLVIFRIYDNTVLAFNLNNKANVCQLKWDDFDICSEEVLLDDLTLKIIENIDNKYEVFDTNIIRKNKKIF